MKIALFSLGAFMMTCTIIGWCCTYVGTMSDSKAQQDVQ